MVSTFDFRDNVIRDSDSGEGRQVVTFNNMLKHKVYPLAEAVDFMLTTGQKRNATSGRDRVRGHHRARL